MALSAFDSLCPKCHGGDQSEGATAVCTSYHLEHIHEGETWAQRHRHMFYRKHQHVGTTPSAVSVAGTLHDGHMPHLNKDGTMRDNHKSFTPQGEDEGKWL